MRPFVARKTLGKKALTRFRAVEDTSRLEQPRVTRSAGLFLYSDGIRWRPLRRPRTEARTDDRIPQLQRRVDTHGPLQKSGMTLVR